MKQAEETISECCFYENQRIYEERKVFHMKTKCRYIVLFLLVFSMAFGSTNTVKVQAAKAKLSEESVIMFMHKTKKLKMKNVKSKVKWSSSNKKLVKIKEKKGKYNQNIVIKAGGKVGNCTVTATVNHKTYVCNVKVVFESKKAFALQNETNAPSDLVEVKEVKVTPGIPECLAKLKLDKDAEIWWDNVTSYIEIKTIWRNYTSKILYASNTNVGIQKLVNGKWVDVSYVKGYEGVVSILLPPGIGAPITHTLYLSAEDEKNFRSGTFRINLGPDEQDLKDKTTKYLKYITFTI